jgi:hypothetical protein
MLSSVRQVSSNSFRYVSITSRLANSQVKSRAARIVSPARSFAQETKKPFTTPPPPPNDNNMFYHRVTVISIGVALITYLFILPRNDYNALPEVSANIPPKQGSTGSDTKDSQA